MKWLALVFSLLVSTAFAQAPHEASIEQLQAEMAAGRLTSRKLVEHFLARIEALDRNGPKLNAVVEINPDALAIADTLDSERKRRRVRGPLHGIPILLKDNIDTADAMSTTAGSLALLGSKPREDAFIVQRLRAAGAVILGKTNLSEWANFRSTRSSSGWSARGGQTRNAHAAERNPCGSSSGSGVAVAAGLAAAAVGTETDGSIVCPSAVNGIVGIKPSVGLVSRSGIIPISISQDTAGPMARSVGDGAMLLAAMMGTDPRDPAMQGTSLAFAVPSAKAATLRGVRIGIARNLVGPHADVSALFEQTIARLKAAGAEIVDPAALDTPADLRTDELAVFLYEFKDGLNRYLGTRTGVPRTLAELIEFNERERAREMPHFGQELFLRAQNETPDEATYRAARERARLAAGMNGIDATLAKHHVEVLIAPTLGPAWLTDHINGDQSVGGGTSRAPAVAGYPHVTVPMGSVRGLPIGLSFIGGAGADSKVVALALAFEQATHSRKAPTLP
jgi:amidase